MIGFARVDKHDLLNEQETDLWLDLVYGSKEKSAGKLHISHKLVVAKRVETMINHVLHKAATDMTNTAALENRA